MEAPSHGSGSGKPTTASRVGAPENVRAREDFGAESCKLRGEPERKVYHCWRGAYL